MQEVHLEEKGEKKVRKKKAKINDKTKE